MAQSHYLTAAACIAVTCLAHAQTGNVTYRCQDESNRATYTNVKEEMVGKKCTVVSREVSVVPAQQSSQTPPPSPSGGGRTVEQRSPADPTAQRARDTDRRRILEQEMQAAEKQLADARQKLAEQESVRSGGERNYQRVLDRLQPFQDEVRRAEENVEALRKELSPRR